MRALSRTLAATAIAAACLTPAAGADPRDTDAVSAVQTVVHGAASDRPLDVPLRASLRQDGPQEPPDRFKPLDDLPPGEQLSGGPLLVTAYSFVMLALFGYMLSVARRLGAVQREVDRLERDMKKSGRA